LYPTWTQRFQTPQAISLHRWFEVSHSATTDGARFLSRLNIVTVAVAVAVAVAVTVRDVVSIVLSYSTVWVVNVQMNAQTNYAAVYPLPALTLFGR
jgi:hypothetical protein